MHRRGAEDAELSFLCRAAERPARHKKHPSGSFPPPPRRPEGAQDFSPGPRPGMGRSVPFLTILKPRGGVTQLPMDALTRGYAPGYDVSPLRGDRSARMPFHTKTERTPLFVHMASAATPHRALTDFFQGSCRRHFRTGSYRILAFSSPSSRRREATSSMSRATAS